MLRTVMTARGILVGALLATVIAPTSARSLEFVSAPVADTVAQIDRDYGVQIVLGTGMSESRTVSFTVPDADGDGACLQAVDALANSLDADYEKQFVVTKLVDGTVPSPPKIDATDAPVVMSDRSMTAEDAITMLAGIDGATVRFYSPVHGDIMLPAGRLTATEAARRISELTDTEWRSVYVLTPRRGGHKDSGAVVIGYTASGSPILMYPDVTFRTAEDVPPPAKAQPNGPAQADAHAAPASAQATAQGQTTATAPDADTTPTAAPPPALGPVLIGGPVGQSGSPFLRIDGQQSTTGISILGGSMGWNGYTYGGATVIQ